MHYTRCTFSTKKLFTLMLSIGVLPFFAVNAAINAPAPPPELSETLTDFRTKMQLQEQELFISEQKDELESGVISEDAEEVESDPIPFVPGDDAAGVARFASSYVPAQLIAVPQYGVAIVRFYDVNNVPWDISSVKVEHPGFRAQITALPSELLIKQERGASSTSLAITLDGYPTPLLLTLKSARLTNQSKVIRTTLNSIKIRDFQNRKDYYQESPKHEVARPNPAAKPLDFDNVDQDRIEKNLIEALRGLNVGNS